MSEIQLTEHEQWLLEQARINDQANDSNVVELAKHLALLPRVEPLLLRNVRLAFVPSAQTETESHLWFSPLVSIRSTQNFIFHRGIAMTLAQELRDEDPKQFNALWIFCQTLTRHWTLLEHLERDLRYALFGEDQNAITVCLQKILRYIHAESDEDERLDLARWAKRNLPALIESPTAKIKETQWLAQYTAATLGDTAKWTELSQPEPLPDWLFEKLPSPLGETSIGLQLRFDREKQQQVLECLDPSEEVQILALNSLLPAKLFVQCDGSEGTWQTIYIGRLIPLTTISENIYLTTLEGQRYTLKSDIKPKDTNKSGTELDDSPLYLSYVEADAQQAQELQQWLTKNGISTKLLLEQPGETISANLKKETKLIRLWTSAAQRLWADVELNLPLSSSQNLMLRTENIPLPKGMDTSSQLLDMINWHRNSDPNVSLQYVKQINDWLSDQSIELNTESNTGSNDESNTDFQLLLQELDDPNTIPPRRLEIGDLLVEIGDTRPGVGVAEFEVMEYPPEIQDLLNELNNLSTEPPRRLAIGDTLAKMGDPRPGVGLNKSGLPDIDWVQIPAGEFLYGEKKTKQHLELDSFHISRYSITNMQYQVFIDDGGYENERWWQDLEKPETVKSRWSHSNRPKTNVNWVEAVAFCRWLSEQLDYKIQLPSEQQWKKAARGTDGREYPWGKKYLTGYANVNEQADKDGDWYLQETTAVGVYPQGNSPQSIADMAGNVWEWCLNKDRRPEVVTADTSKDTRVLRGGSWLRSPELARVSYRSRHAPGNRYGHIGFRVCCVLPSTDH